MFDVRENLLRVPFTFRHLLDPDSKQFVFLGSFWVIKLGHLKKKNDSKDGITAAFNASSLPIPNVG